MAVNLRAPARIEPVAGAEWAVGEAAIKKPGRNDIALLKLADDATVAGVFTRNRAGETFGKQVEKRRGPSS